MIEFQNNHIGLPTINARVTLKVGQELLTILSANLLGPSVYGGSVFWPVKFVVGLEQSLRASLTLGLAPVLSLPIEVKLL